MPKADFLVFAENTAPFPIEMYPIIELKSGKDIYYKVKETLPYSWLVDLDIMNGLVQLESRFELFTGSDASGVRVVQIRALADKGIEIVRMTYCKPATYVAFEVTVGEKLSALVKILQ